MVAAICRFRQFYQNRTIYSLVACQQAPKDDPRVQAPDIQAWVRRIFTGRPASLSEATRALNRWLIEFSKPSTFRTESQIMIREDYMSSVSLDVQYADLGEFLSVCADIAFKTGQYSALNKADNAHAHRRKERFVTRLLTLATRVPHMAVAQASQEINRFLGAIPAAKAHKAPFLRNRLNVAFQKMTLPLGVPNQHQQVSIWKGFTDHQQQLALERRRVQDEAEAASTTTQTESTN